MSYIKKNYCIPAIITCAVCVIGLAMIGYFTFNTNEWSYGIIVLLFLAFVLGTLAIVSLVAMYREVGRLHDRKFPSDMIDLMTELIKKVEECEKSCIKETVMDGKINDLKAHINGHFTEVLTKMK